MMTTLPDGSTVRVTRALVEHRGTDGTLLAEREPTDTDLAALDAWAAEQPPMGDVAWQAHREDRALDSHRAEIRAAGVRLRQIETQGVALAESTPPPTSTAAEVKAAVDGQAVQIRAISRAAADMAAYLLELGRVVLRDAS